VILDPGDYARWLGEQPVTADELQALLRPYPHEPMRIYPIGAAIGSVKNDGPELIIPTGSDLMMVAA
jgi:putative SOS response-associated peptidase YedK